MYIQKVGNIGDCGTEVFKMGRSQQRGLGGLSGTPSKKMRHMGNESVASFKKSDLSNAVQ